MAAACVLAGCSVLDGLHGAAPAADVAADGAEIAVLRWVRDAPALELLTPDGTVVRSQALTGEAAASLEAIGPDVAWSPDGRQIAVTGYTGTGGATSTRTRRRTSSSSPLPTVPCGG